LGDTSEEQTTTTTIAAKKKEARASRKLLRFRDGAAAGEKSEQIEARI
jgi:hypothetical protein